MGGISARRADLSTHRGHQFIQLIAEVADQDNAHK
jgi:hypothetical protein